MIIDLFAGPRGWSEGLRMLGLTDVGIEIDASACATAAAAGHLTIRADVASMPLDRFIDLVEGMIASPPCPMFSAAGKGAGREVLDELRQAIRDAFAGRNRLDHHRQAMARRLSTAYHWHTDGLTIAAADARAERDATEAALTVEPARWIAATRPRWVALEQVPAVLPLWQTYAYDLRRLGYTAWAGILNAADYGVPQTRRRAFLLATLDGPIGPPRPTHSRTPGATLFDHLLPWVSMADALGWPETWAVELHRGAGLLERHGERPVTPATEPSPTIRAGSKGSGPNLLVLQPGGQSHRKRPTLPRPLAEPAPTLAFGHDSAAWVFERPATTIAGDARCWPPGHKVNADDRRRHADADERYGDRAGTDAIRLTLADALTLQSFRPDYPVQGTKTKQFEQVGNAVPPLLAAHVLAALTGHTLEAAA